MKGDGAERLELPTPEWRLLLACTRIRTTADDEAAIREALRGEIDWTLLARKTVDHGLTSLVGHTLARIAPDAVPKEILAAFRTVVEQTRRSNRAQFDEIVAVTETLAADGIDAIPFKGPVLAIGSYGDLGLRIFRDLDFLIRDSDLAATITALDRLGYRRAPQLSAHQLELIHRIQGQEIIFKETGGNALEPHTRLTSAKMALDIDYTGIWRRARRAEFDGRSMLTLAPEDDFITLAIHGGKEMWWNVKWACDVAAFIRSHPDLDWNAVIARARAQGCLRMVLLATALARRFFASPAPAAIAAGERADPALDQMIERITAIWLAEEVSGPASNSKLSMDRLRLHDRTWRRARYVARTLLLPGPHHVATMPLPRELSFAYVPLSLMHDFLALPLWQAYCQTLEQGARLWGAIAGSDLALAVVASSEERLNIRRWQKARAAAERAVAADPDNAAAWRDLGDALAELKRFKQAVACYDKALAAAPHNTSTWKKRAAALAASGEKAKVAEPDPEPQDAKGWGVRASRLFSMGRFLEASEASDNAVALDPEDVIAARIGIQSRLFTCDWSRREDEKRRISEAARAGRILITPFFHRAICDSEAEHALLTRLSARTLPRATPLWAGERYHHDKIRIAYVSTDFRDHVVPDVIAGCFEHHDRTRFELTAISLGPNDRSRMRARLESAFDRFLDMQAVGDAQVAQTIRELEIDIAVDLNGSSGECRTGILARKPAALQVNYLGYAGTMGATFFDYILADRTVIPEENRIYYSEKVVYLPHTYMPLDRKRPIATRVPSRIEAGLPETGFVFACHNQDYKIAPEIFAVWMRLLRSIEGSVLWLKAANPAAVANLWREAATHGVAPERLVFAPRVPKADEHLARLRHADLFLDTLPYNAHATTCDALWAGLPVLTCLGNTFAARVAGSILRAAGLPELVTTSLAEYEALARSLALGPDRLAALKSQLARNRDTAPLFDTARFTRDLEAAYSAIHERQQKGLPAESFAVTGYSQSSRLGCPMRPETGCQAPA